MLKPLSIAVTLVLASFLATSPAMAEESPAFVARNQAMQANLEQHEQAFAAKTREQEKAQQASTYNPQVENAKHT
ncbi:hypothetical protein [Pseudomonas sp. LP_7_YM]|uniref:hypothetical protein n=1 Tax=Pseudomonas sp. LP_7_YM TaxID=2485137 RepID=UPI00105BB6EF|nr:hypothetical protein [Pseudomonas sp. LP_7_YM]TDV70284.1 hypothetical protein EC915_102549 [Pseudomonas sp. LP_7_YM]